MTQIDYRGARGSNAGDDFHELWVVRNALALLEHDGQLSAITVEGIMKSDEVGTPRDTWDGVDCALYYGGGDAQSAQRIEIVQVKYSAADPLKPWTASRLTSRTKTNSNSSVLDKLARAFVELKSRRPDLVKSRNLRVRFISNQPVNPNVFASISGNAVNLAPTEFQEFVNAIDLTECGGSSRFALEERIIQTISAWIDDDASSIKNDLMRYVRRMMMPEGKGQYLTRYSILACFGFSDPGALFPCPPVMDKVNKLVSRQISKDICDLLLKGEQFLCLHGEAGCGKTTALQDVKSLLPPGSTMVVFDCYGGGHYLNTNSFRHRPQDAFLELSNDLARQLLVPLLVNSAANATRFMKRLERAAEVVRAADSNAILAVAIDAADNSIIAADEQSPRERSFVHDFVHLGPLPGNVRILLTTRTGRMPSLNLPRAFKPVEMQGFSHLETAAFVRTTWNEAGDTWIDDFHDLSAGNPRVQRYALDYAGNQPERALEYLRPSGKVLNHIFREHFQHALQKEGGDQNIKLVCAGLIELPRPIPVKDLSIVTELREALVRDICRDLSPGVHLAGDSIEFADEDFEDFVRVEAKDQLSHIRARIADHFSNCYKTDAYASAHLAAALFKANRKQDIIDLIRSETEPSVIPDPVRRRATQLERLRIAMKVCRESGSNSDAVMTLLIGAEALKTNAVLNDMFIKNPDLTAVFCQDTAARTILRNPDEIETHGSILFHTLAAEARRGNALSAREVRRQLDAWLLRRAEYLDKERKKDPGFEPRGWEIEDDDIVSETEAALRIAGPSIAMSNLLRWRPRTLAPRVATSLATRLLISGDVTLLKSCLVNWVVDVPWDIFILVPLALAGEDIDISRLEAGLLTLQRHRLIRMDQLQNTLYRTSPVVEFLDIVITACELFLARGGDHIRILPVLQHIADKEIRRRDRLYPSNASLIDICLRAHALIERAAGRDATIETFCVSPPDPPKDLADDKLGQMKEDDNRRKEDLKNLLEPVLDIYNVRAQAITGIVSPENIEGKMKKAISHFHGEDYRFRRQFGAHDLITRTSLAIARLMVVPGLDRDIILDCTGELLGPKSATLGEQECLVFSYLALERKLHPQILERTLSLEREIKGVKISADEKIEAIVRLSRLLLHISKTDAEILFRDAIDVASEVNADVIHEIRICEPLALRAADLMTPEIRRETAYALATIVSDAAIRLSGQEGFPWKAAATAIASLDVCTALAATGRWDDCEIVTYGNLLPHVLSAGLARNVLSPSQAVSFLPLMDEMGIDLVRQTVDRTRDVPSKDLRRGVIEEIARSELLICDHLPRKEVGEALNSLLDGEPCGSWTDQLIKAINFVQNESPKIQDQGSLKHEPRPDTRNGVVNADPLDQIKWEERRFVTSLEIETTIRDLSEKARLTQSYVSPSTILDRIASRVALRDWVSHLEALARCEDCQAFEEELTEAILCRLREWRDSPSVQQWCRTDLLRVIVDRLPTISRWIWTGQSRLPLLLEQSCSPDKEVFDALLQGIERHVDSLEAPSVYALVGLAIRYCPPTDARQVLVEYSNRLRRRIPQEEQEVWNLSDVPSKTAGGIARFVYALMGDIDVRIRWRAAHALRLLARLQHKEELKEIITLYSITSEISFRDPESPFYWLAARLWLVIALNRIAQENPGALAAHGLMLVDISVNKDFPHVLIRSFAKHAVSKLVRNRVLRLSKSQHRRWEKANTTPFRRRKIARVFRLGSDRTDKKSESRRFHFDFMDTIPYWYSRAVSCFANLQMEEFLDVAERWIVDTWQVKGQVWRWDQQPRPNHFKDNYELSGNRHGSRPTLERYDSYLEWHAMFCTVGELLQRKPLSAAGKDEYNSFEYWLEHECLSAPPFWLSDLRGSKPLESRFWFMPSVKIESWVDQIQDEDFLIELGLPNDNHLIILQSYHNTQSRAFTQNVRVRSALVSPSTASALVRALQSVDSSADYRIPDFGDDLEIDAPPYQLLGWLDRIERDTRIDEHDPLRNQTRDIEYRPSNRFVRTNELQFQYGHPSKWTAQSGRVTVLEYDAWSDFRHSEDDRRYRYDEQVRSDGWRLLALRDVLRNHLKKMNLDMIVEIEITRRNKPYVYSEYDSEKTKEAIFDKILLLRKDGTIETAEGPIGAWTAPGK